jgi:hypothetical protein
MKHWSLDGRTGFHDIPLEDPRWKSINVQVVAPDNVIKAIEQELGWKATRRAIDNADT